MVDTFGYGGTALVKAAVYADAGGVPGGRLSGVGSISSTPSDQGTPITITLPGGGVGLQAGTYWLVVGSPDQIQMNETLEGSVDTSSYISYGTGSGSLPNTLPTPFYNPSAKMQILAEWTCP